MILWDYVPERKFIPTRSNPVNSILTLFLLILEECWFIFFRVRAAIVQVRERFKYIGLAVLLGLGAALPVVVALSAPVFGFDPVRIKTLISRSERFVAVLFLLVALLAFVFHRRVRQLLEKYNEIAHSISISRFLILFPLLSFILYNLIYTLFAYRGLFLVDLDFTGISSAMNNTAHGVGLLTTPYFNTGSSGSYLGHHFSWSLILFVPFYKLAVWFMGFFPLSQLHPTHLLYGLLLLGVQGVGIYLWADLIRREIRQPLVALLAAVGLAFAYPLWRLTLSYHYELPVLPLSALLFGALRENKKGIYWISLFLWLGLKEDMAVYLCLFALYLFFERRHRSLALRTMLVCGLYFLMVMFPLRHFFTGGAGPDWNLWRHFSGKELKFEPAFEFVRAFAFLPLLRPRLMLLVIAPLMLIQLFSSNPWHSTFYGHYGYTVLPFLLLGYMEGLNRLPAILTTGKRLRWAVLFCIPALIAYSAAADREMPAPLIPPDDRAVAVAELMHVLPPGSCLQTEPPFSALAPLNVHVFPVYIPAGNPYRDRLPPRAGIPAGLPAHCTEYRLLIDENLVEPFYRPEEVARIRNYAQNELRLLGRRGGLSLYGP